MFAECKSSEVVPAEAEVLFELNSQLTDVANRGTKRPHDEAPASTQGGASGDENAWKWERTLMYRETPGVTASSKIAAFDFVWWCVVVFEHSQDGCLANTSLFKKGPDAWSVLFPTCSTKLRALSEDNFKLVIFTNQSAIGKATKTKAATIAEKQARLDGFVALMGLPFQIFVATTKTSEPDWFRKPCIGMWEYMRCAIHHALHTRWQRQLQRRTRAGPRTILLRWRRRREAQGPWKLGQRICSADRDTVLHRDRVLLLVTYRHVTCCIECD